MNLPRPARLAVLAALFAGSASGPAALAAQTAAGPASPQSQAPTTTKSNGIPYVKTDTPAKLGKEKYLPDAVLAQYLEAAARARKAEAEGRIRDAEAEFLQAWSMFPAPQLEYDRAGSLARVLTEFYLDHGMPEKARPWLRITADYYQGEGGFTLDLLTAAVAYHCGEHAAAYAGFDHIYQNYNQREFRRRYPKYFEFYRREAAAWGKKIE